MYKILFLWFWFCVFLIFSSESGTIRPDGKCTQLAGAYCVEIKDCPNINEIVRLSPPPLQKAAAQIIRKHLCGFKGINPLVCCWFRTEETTELPDLQSKTAPPPDVSYQHHVHMIFPEADFDIFEAYP